MGQLEGMGMREADESEQATANLVVLNTCSIRDKPEQKVYSHLGPHAMRKRRGEPVAIVVAGCVAQQEGEKLLRRVPEIDLVMGPQFSNRMSDLLEDVMNGNQLVATDPLHIMEDMTKPKRMSTVAAWVNVSSSIYSSLSVCLISVTAVVNPPPLSHSILGDLWVQRAVLLLRGADDARGGAEQAPRGHPRGVQSPGGRGLPGNHPPGPEHRRVGAGHGAQAEVCGPLNLLLRGSRHRSSALRNQARGPKHIQRQNCVNP